MAEDATTQYSEQADPIPWIRVSVWRPADLQRSLAYYPEVVSQGRGQVRDSDEVMLDLDLLQEEVYSWDPGQTDVLASLSNASDTEPIRAELFGLFSPKLLPSERTLKSLLETVDRLEGRISGVGKLEWVATSQQFDPNRSDRGVLWVNTMGALLEHLRWIATAFEHVPRASVSIR